MQMQELRKPPHNRVLSPLKGFPLFHIALIAPCGESMRRAGKVLIVVFDVQGGNHAVGMRFHFGGQLRIVLRGDDLNGDGNGADFLFCRKRRVSDGNAVDQVFA